MSIGILTDSTADLRGDLLEKYNIEIIPLSVQFGNKTFKDGVDLSPEEFFNKLKKVDYLPGTSQPSLALFKNKYQEMAEKYDFIISIHPSSSLSGTYSTAKLAAKQLPDIDITTIDSSSVSLGLGFLALLAAKMAEASHSVDKILKAIDKAKENLLLYFTVDEFKYMEQGGRIGKARAFLGSVLNINPIITIKTETGQVEPLDKTRGKKRTMKRMVSLAMERLDEAEKAWLGFAHGDRAGDMNQFKDKLLSKIKNTMDIDIDTFKARINPTLGCHVGPSVYAGFILPLDFLNDI